MKSLIKRAENIEITTQIKFQTQTLFQKLKKIHQENRELKFANYQLTKKFSQLGNTQNNIPSLTQLVNVALKRKRSVRYILDEVTEVIDGVYIARASNDDKDLAFLVLKFGGPSLLDILYQANVFPSTSTAYHMAKKM